MEFDMKPENLPGLERKAVPIPVRRFGHEEPAHRDPKETAMPSLAPSTPCTYTRRVEDRELMTMSRVFGEHGGMVCADELVRCMRKNVAQPLSIVGRWIAERAAVQFAWRSQTWFPCFQFAGNPMSIRPVVSELVLELRDTCDDWELALWFASRNERLGHMPPVEVIRCDPAAVVRAARIDCLIAKG